MASRFILSFRTPIFFLLIITGFIALLLTSDFANVKSQQKPAETQTSDLEQTVNSTSEPSHWLVGSYYNSKNGMTATLFLNNKGIQPLEVRPTLYNMAGQELVLPPVIVEASSHRFIDLSEWASIGGESFRQGSIRLFHYGKDLVLGAQLYLVDEAHSLSFEEKLAEFGRFDSRRLEAVWAMPSRDTDVKIALSNTTNTVLSITTRLTRSPHNSSDAQTIELQPRETRLLDLKQEIVTGEQKAHSEALALSLEHGGAKEALLARVFISEAERGYSNLAQFSNPTLGKSKALHGAGLSLGTVAGERLMPVVVVRNTSNQKATVTARVAYTRTDGTSGMVVLPSTRLKQNEVSLLDMRQVERRSEAEAIQVAGLEIEYDAPAGSVLVSAHSESPSGNQVFRVPMWDVLAQRSPTGCYPWHIEETSTTKAYIKNVTDREQDYIAFLLYENGSRYMIGMKTVQPHQTIEIDVQALRDNQVPDEEGVTIPLHVSSGQLQWTLRRRDEPARRDDELDKLALVGRSEQVDVIHGISSNYACQNCCAGTFLSGSIEPHNIEFEAGDVYQFRAYESGQTCYGYQYPTQVYPNNWSSTNLSVATVGSSTGIVTMQSAGTAGINANWSIERSYENYPCGGGGEFTASTDAEAIVSKGEQEAVRVKDIQPSIEACGTCVHFWFNANPSQANLTVRPTVAKIQYQSGSDYIDVSGTLYVFKGTAVTFKAVPNPANASFPSGRPVWGGSSGATGSGQTKEVTFSTVSTATDDFKIVTAFSGNTKVVNVVVYDLIGVLTPEDNFTGRSTTRFGIHELLTLSFSTTPSGITAAQIGGMQWAQISGNGSFAQTSTSGSGAYEVSNSPDSATLKLKILEGPSKDAGPSQSITVVAPSDGTARRAPLSGVRHYQDWWSCGFVADLFVLPADVSFGGLWFKEEEIGATTSGWLSFAQGVPHNTGGTKLIGTGTSTGSRVGADDEVFGGKYRSLEHGAYASGTINWAIPWKYSTNDGATWNSIVTASQTASSTSTGKCLISKQGSGSYSKELTDADSEW